MSDSPETPSPVVSVVVVTWNTRDLTLACLESLHEDESALEREIILVDNASEDDTVESVRRRFPGVRIVENGENLLFSRANNLGVEAARGRYVCLLNSDTEVRPGAIDRMVEFLRENPDYAVVGPRLVNPDGSTQRSCYRLLGIREGLCEWTFLGRFPPGSRIYRRRHMLEFDNESSRDVPQLMGACLVYRTDEYLRNWSFDPELSLYFNTEDLFVRLARAGARVRYLAGAVVMHHQGKSAESFGPIRSIRGQNRLAYYRKHHGLSGVISIRLLLALRRVESLIRNGWRRLRGLLPSRGGDRTSSVEAPGSRLPTER